MITLDSPQIDFLNKIDEAIAQGVKRILARAPTGFGKTVVASYIINRAEQQGQRVMMSVHRDALLRQTAMTFNNFNVYYGFIASGRKRDPFAPAQLVSIDTMKNCYDRVSFVPDILLVDEAHLSLAEGWMEVLKYYAERGTTIIALTATPELLSNKSFSPFYQRIVCGVTEKWLMNNINPRTGLTYLSDYVAKVAPPPALDGVKTRNEDYVKRQLAQWLRKSSIVGDSAKSWKQYAAGKRTIAFRVSVEDSLAAVEYFNAQGIRSAHIDGETPEDERNKIINNFADGGLDVLSNVEIFSEGFDLSAQVGRDVPIEAVILERPTQSYALHAQQVGRALRPKKDKAIILDHVGNLLRHGLPDKEYEWTLDGRKNKSFTIDNDKLSMVLPEAKPRSGGGGGGKRVIERHDGELVDLSDEDRAHINDDIEGDPAAVRMLMRIAMRQGMENPRAWAQEEYAKNHS